MDTGVNISVAGGTSYSVQYNLDGAAHLDMFVGTNMPLPFPDALQEFKLVTSSQDASSGGHAAAAVNSVTKSGTNELHGDLFWFLRNAALNSRDAFAARERPTEAQSIWRCSRRANQERQGILFSRIPGHNNTPDPVECRFLCPHSGDAFGGLLGLYLSSQWVSLGRCHNEHC